MIIINDSDGDNDIEGPLDPFIVSEIELVGSINGAIDNEGFVLSKGKVKGEILVVGVALIKGRVDEMNNIVWLKLNVETLPEEFVVIGGAPIVEKLLDGAELVLDKEFSVG